MKAPVRIEPFAKGGFSVVYPTCDHTTVQRLREYQAQLRSQGGWISRLQLSPEGSCRVNVFPLDQLPAAVLMGNRRAW